MWRTGRTRHPTCIDNLPTAVHHPAGLFRVRELLAEADDGAVVRLVDVGSVDGAARANVVLTNAVPVGWPTADSVAKNGDLIGTGTNRVVEVVL